MAQESTTFEELWNRDIISARTIKLIGEYLTTYQITFDDKSHFVVRCHERKGKTRLMLTSLDIKTDEESIRHHYTDVVSIIAKSNQNYHEFIFASPVKVMTYDLENGDYLFAIESDVKWTEIEYRKSHGKYIGY